MAMRFIGTRSLSRNVSDWLTLTCQPRILHIFKHACNLVNEHRDVLSIVTSQIGNGPFNLVIEGDVLFFDQIDIQTRVSNSLHKLTIGDTAFDTTNAELWNARPDWGLLHSRRFDILRQLIELEFANPAESTSPVSSLSAALARSDISAVVAQSSQLAGLGAGLTPSGDDLIMGALYASWIIHPNDVAESLAREIACAAAPLTTSLSAAWIRSAGKGEAGHVWHTLFDALISGEKSAIQLQITNILSIGATSGTDALAGFINTFIAYAETRKSHVISKLL